MFKDIPRRVVEKGSVAFPTIEKSFIVEIVPSLPGIMGEDMLFVPDEGDGLDGEASCDQEASAPPLPSQESWSRTYRLECCLSFCSWRRMRTSRVSMMS